MFPYPSGLGLHVGHPKGYIATDVVARAKQLQGFGVLHPMGWDAFGLPAEQFALKHKVHPSRAVENNIATYKRQLDAIGFTYDWDREINTTDPRYYRWTQWIFLQMFEKGLAYESDEPINWCPSCQTGLANEDLDDGACERCGTIVEQKPMRQWVLRMTAYADRLLEGLDRKELEWSEEIKAQQRHWIGRSEGAEIDFKIDGSDKVITVFTTRPDTLFGATYCVLAPENKLIDELKGSVANWSEVESYREEVKSRTEIERTAEGHEKTGVRLEEVSAINPANDEKLPVFVADYVLGHYGTGAVMAVPAHDERDFAFARKFNLPIRDVISRIYILKDENKEKDGLETLHRRVVDPIIRDKEGNFYLIKESEDHVHFAGGGIDEGENEIQALSREIIEETGFTDFTIGDRLYPQISCWGYRHTKNKNQRSVGPAYEIILNSNTRIHSEVEDGRHELLKIKKEDVLKTITWEHHQYLFERYLGGQNAYIEEGVLIDSGEFTGLSSEEAKKKITDFVKGRWVTKYRLKDWVFSRQRYWGEPIPIIHCEHCGAVPVPEKDLPVKLPEVESYAPTGTGESPLADIPEWVNTPCPKCGGAGKRETNTMPQWAGSCWYYLRFIDPMNEKSLVGGGAEAEWMPVDLYVGGAEHATRHLLYARFWHKFLFDIKAVSTDEPFKRLVHVGLINASDGRKMSKRWGNVVNPDDIIRDFGADAFRLYELFMGPFTQNIAWNTEGLVGTRRFLDKAWSVRSHVSEEKDVTDAAHLEALLHKTIGKVTEDIDAFRFNTAISSLMILANAMSKEPRVSKSCYETFVLLLSPFAPHIAEELWRTLGHGESVFLAVWPAYDNSKVLEESVVMTISINGKMRDLMTVPQDISEEDLGAQALIREKIRPFLEGKTVKKIIIVPGRIVNIVI